MPVTAKLSREFYEKFGDKVADELVNWFNQVDATYRSDLKDLNEMNFARFDAKLEQRLAELRSEITQRFAEADARLVRGLAEVRAEFAQRFAESDVRWEGRLADLKTSMIRWMFGLWTVGTLTILGTVLAILRL